MTEEWKDLEQDVPTLTLDPGMLKEEKTKSQVLTEERQPEPMDESILSEEERKMVDAFAAQIDLTNTNQILQYGAGTQKKMADFSETALENVKTQDLGEVGELIAGVVNELKNFDAEEEKGFFGFFKKQSNRINSMKIRYEKAEVNVGKIVEALKGHQMRLLKDSAILDKMYAQNLVYFQGTLHVYSGGKEEIERNERGTIKGTDGEGADGRTS